jgi:hypothetical protein
MPLKKSQVVSKPLKSKPKPTLEDLKQLLRDNLVDLRREYHVGSLWLFGSYVRGEQHKRSDLDILVEFVEVTTLPKLISPERKLREITGIKVDLVSICALKDEIGERILRENVAL